jgi:N-acetylmuramoyl-L-alanine amidase
LQSRQLIVVHDSISSFAAAEVYFQQAAARGSVHILIARDGTVKQLVPFDYAAAHAGNGRWNGLSVNKNSLGIELESWGPLTRKGDAWYPSFYQGKPVPDEQVIRLQGEDESSGWHKYTDAQMRAFFNVACALRRAYPTITQLIGHDQLDKNRKEPSPIFPMEKMRERLSLGGSSVTGYTDEESN